MSKALAILVTALLTSGPPPETAIGPQPSLDTLERRRAVLEQALADYDAAVSLEGKAGTQAQVLYRKALSGFESLLQEADIRNGGLHYNAANTYFRLGEIGSAIVHYRRALMLMPGDGLVMKNLEAARSLCRVQIPTPATSAFIHTLFYWHFGTSIRTRTTLALAAYLLFWALMLLRLFTFRRAPAFVWTVRAVAALVLILGLSVTWERIAPAYQAEGVIIAEEIVLRKGNSEDYEPRFEQTLSQGVEFRLIETRPGLEGASWYHIELRDGKAGWLRADQAEVI